MRKDKEGKLSKVRAIYLHLHRATLQAVHYLVRGKHESDLRYPIYRVIREMTFNLQGSDRGVTALRYPYRYNKKGIVN